MDIKNLKKFIELAKESGVGELKYESEGEKYYVNLQQITAEAPKAQITTPLQSTVVESTNSKPVAQNVKEVTSPFVGTFYRSPSPDAESYINVGDNINKGKTLCIIEAMKIMNEIESEFSGEIIEICVENESYVEFGEVLFKIKI